MAKALFGRCSPLMRLDLPTKGAGDFIAGFDLQFNPFDKSRFV